jgi:hypothetical protein
MGDVTLAYRGVSTATDRWPSTRRRPSTATARATLSAPAPPRTSWSATSRSQPARAGRLIYRHEARGRRGVRRPTFGSDRYFAFAAAERILGAAALCWRRGERALELLGRAFRVTDPAARPQRGRPGPRAPPSPTPAGRERIVTASREPTGTTTPAPAPTPDPAPRPRPTAAPEAAHRTGGSCRRPRRLPPHRRRRQPRPRRDHPRRAVARVSRRPAVSRN